MHEYRSPGTGNPTKVPEPEIQASRGKEWQHGVGDTRAAGSLGMANYHTDTVMSMSGMANYYSDTVMSMSGMANYYTGTVMSMSGMANYHTGTVMSMSEMANTAMSLCQG